MTDIKVLLNNIFPAGICDEICNCNLHCSKCKELNDNERRYVTFNYHFDHFEEKELTRVENKYISLKQGWRNHLSIYPTLTEQMLE